MYKTIKQPLGGIDQSAWKSIPGNTLNRCLSPTNEEAPPEESRRLSRNEGLRARESHV